MIDISFEGGDDDDFTLCEYTFIYTDLQATVRVVAHYVSTHLSTPIGRQRFNLVAMVSYSSGSTINICIYVSYICKCTVSTVGSY